MVTVEEAAVAAQTARQLAQQKRQEALEVQEKLKQQEQSLPQFTQQRLRSGLFSGRQGIQRRQQVQSARSEIGRQKEMVGGFIGDISTFEKEQIEPVERQIENIRAEQGAYNTAKDIFYDKSPYAAFRLSEESDRVKYYYDQLSEGSDAARQAFATELQNQQAQLPEGEKLIIDWKNLRVKGIESQSLGGTFTVEGYNKRVEEFNKNLGQAPNINVRGLDRTDITRDLNVPKFTSTGFGIVSAQSNNLISEVTPTQLSGVIKPQGTFTSTPRGEQARTEFFKREIEQKGAAGGILSVFSSDVQDVLDLSGINKQGQRINVRPIAETAPYFTPAAAPLLIAQGVGEFTIPARKEKLKESNLALQQQGVNPFIATGLTYGLPTAEILLGSGGRFLRTSPELTRAGTIKIPTRTLKAPEALQVSTLRNVGGKPYVESRFSILREVSPPQTIIKQGRQGLLGLDDTLKVTPPKIERTFTPFKVQGNEPFITATAKNPNVAKISQISGESAPRTLSELRNLPKREQFLWQRVAEDVAGRPVALQNVPKIINKDLQLSRGYINEYSYSKPFGKKTSQFETASALKVSKQTPTYDIFTGRTLYKDVSKPFARATGRTPKLKETVIFLKPKPEEAQGFSSFVGGGKKSSQAYLQQLYKQGIVVPKPAPKIIKPSKTKLINTPSTYRNYGILGLLSGMGSRNIVRPSEFINSDFSSGFGQGIGFNFAKASGSSQSAGAGLSLGSTEGFRTASTTSSSSVLLSKVKDILSLKSNQNLFQPSRSVQTPVQKNVPSQKFTLKQAYRLLQKQGTPQPKPQRPRQPNRPNQPPTFIPRLFSIPASKKTTVASNADFFGAFGRRKGKDILLGTFPTQRGAEFELRKFLKGTLGASGTISKGERALEFKELNLFGGEFTPAKRQSTRIVQKRGTRLGTGFEVAEIQRARKGRSQLNWFA